MSVYSMALVTAVLGIIVVVIPSYIVSGWMALVLSPHYSFDDIPDMTGKVVLVTGSNTGIGLVTCRELARKGARVIGTTRSIEKGQDALETIEEALRNEPNKGSVEYMQLDLSSMANVKQFTEKLVEKVSKIDIMILNAGVMFPPFQTTEDGFEMTIGTNHLGHFLLVKRLLPLIEHSKTRLVHVSSLAHYYPYKNGIDVRTFTDESLYDRYKAYGQSKLANILFSNELARRLEGTGVTSNALHPGSIMTDLTRHVRDSLGGRNKQSTFSKMMTSLSIIGERLVLMKTDAGAFTQLYVATSPDVQQVTGKYFTPVGVMTEPTALAKNETLQAYLWKISDELTHAFQ